VDRPKLRPLDVVPVEKEGQVFVRLHDPSRLSDKVALVPQEMLHLLVLFDGEHSIVDIQAALMRRFGQLVPSQQIQEIIGQLDEVLFLESDRFREHVRRLVEEFRRSPVRPSSSAGLSYPSDPKALAAQLDASFTAKGGPGRPRPYEVCVAQPPSAVGCERTQPRPAVPHRLVGLVAPHIDFERGGPSYAWAYKALGESCDADLFVVFGTAHHGNDSLYILTHKAFETPFGTLPTHGDLVDAVARRYGRDVFADELLHKTEHSIEFQVVMLQHMLNGRSIEMVPVLCGGMERQVGEAESPGQVAEVSDFFAALREALAASGRRVCAIAGADLAHVGRQFGDEFDLTPEVMSDVERADRETLGFVQSLDADGFYNCVRRDDNARHICGVPPIYALLSTIDATCTQLLDYRQAVDFEPGRAVTFASLALYA